MVQKNILAIVGGRDFNDNYKLVEEVNFFLPIDKIVSGGANGADSFGVQYAINNGIDWQVFEAAWDDVETPDAVVRYNKWGKPYNVVAGHWRNALIADAATQMIAFWNGRSTGTSNAIKCMKNLQRPVKIIYY